MPVTTRSRLFLETASEPVGETDWPYKQVVLSLREQGPEPWKVRLFASDTPDAIDDVARGEADVAIVNPAGPLAQAYRGTGPYAEPLPLRVITVIPSLDQLAFAVTARTGISSLADIRERRYPLRVSVRGQRDHSVHFIVKQVLAAVGFSLEDLVDWGGEVRYDPGLPDTPHRIGAVQRGEIDAIFDEAVNAWAHEALELGMRFLPLDEPLLRHMEGLGYRHGVIAKAEYPALPADVPALDFSGWPVFTRADAPDELITALCRALEARKDRIPWQGQGPLPLEHMCRDTPEGPLDLPLHPAAERFWRAQGYLR
jgi:TRAP-type uncharacterized transport system substrate-binding protein